MGNIEIKSLKRAYRKPTKNMTSYDYMLKGRALNQKYNKESMINGSSTPILTVRAQKLQNVEVLSSSKLVVSSLHSYPGRDMKR